MNRIVEKNGKHFIEITVQGGSEKVLYPAGNSLADAKRLLKEMSSLNRNTWQWFKPKKISERKIDLASKRFRAAETREFARTRKIVMVTDTPERFLPLKDGGLNPTAAVIMRNGFKFEMISTSDVEKGRLKEYAVAVFPGGFGYFPGARFAKRVRDYVRGGGGYLGFCAGAFLPLKPSHGIKGGGLGMLDARYEYFREKGMAHVILNPDDPVAFDVKNSTRDVVLALYKRPSEMQRHTVNISMLRANGPLFLAGPKSAVVGYYEGSRPFGAIIRGEYGKGRIVLFSAHPDSPVPDIAAMASPADAIENRKLVKNAILYCGGMHT